MANIDCYELEKLVEAGHTLYKAIEGRDLTYKILRKFIECGYCPYSNINQDLDDLEVQVDTWIDYKESKKEEIKKFIGKIKSNPTLGGLALLFLLSWNMNRYKDCDNFFLKKLIKYANYLDKNLQEILSKAEELRKKTIKDIEWDNDAKTILERIHKILQMKEKNSKSCFMPNCPDNCENEYVGAIKLASVFFPKIFIPIDNPIAEALCFKCPKKPFSLEIYKKFWESIKNLIQECPDLISKLKHIDELFYVLFSLKEKKRKIICERFGFKEDCSKIKKKNGGHSNR